MGELAVWKETFDKLKNAVEFVASAAEKERKAADAHALETIDAAFAETLPKLIGDSVTEEALDRFVAAHTRTIKSGADIFPESYRRRFLEDFLRRNPQARGYKDVCGQAVERYFDEAERLLQANFPGVAPLLGNIVSQNEKLDRIDNRLNGMSGELHEIHEWTRPVPEGLHTSNKLYCKTFTEPMFLHKGKKNVCLRNLYVQHRFVGGAGTLEKYLSDFIQKDSPQFLLIEGDAGCGKSGLTAYLAYQFKNDEKFPRDIFGDKRLITVRLRDKKLKISGNGKEPYALTEGILNFLCVSKSELLKLNPVLLLDGYDELCTVPELGDPQEALDALLRALECKIILTCRPGYIKTALFQNGEFQRPYRHIVLQHFDRDQRNQWLGRYQKASGETVGEEKLQYLENIDADTICDTPMGLYMVAAGHFGVDALKNEWALYHQIFGRELGETEYTVLDENDLRKEHRIQKYQEEIYRVSEEIAYWMYQNHNENLQISGKGIAEIVRNLNIEEDKKKIIEDCYALCGYWIADPDRGGAEFYHNNIRDFFLCEKIMQELNGGYENDNPEMDPVPFLKRIAGLLRYGLLEERVLDFIRLRAVYKNLKNAPDRCVETEKEHRLLPRLFERLLLRSDAYSDALIPEENPVKTVRWIAGNFAWIFSHIYSSTILEDNELIYWWTEGNRDKIEKDGTFQMLAGTVLRYAARSALQNMNLRGSDLRNADLHDSDLRGADLSGADLGHANLHGSDLSNANLNRSNLGYAELY